MNAFVQDQDTALRVRSGNRMFIIDDQYVIHKVSESLYKYFEQKWHRSVKGRICYAALFNSDKPCKNCPVEKCFTFNREVQSIVTAQTSHYDVPRHAKATPVQDSQGVVRQVIVECLTPVQTGAFGKKQQEPKKSLDQTHTPEMQVNTQEAGYVLMNPELRVLLHNKGVRSFCRYPYIIGRYLYEAIPLFDQPGIRYQIDTFVKERSDSIEFYTHTQADQNGRICHRIQRMNSGNRNEVILLESRPEPEKSENDVPKDHNLQLLSSFAAQLAHDIGNPLTGLLGYVNLMRNDLNQATTQQDLLSFQENVDNIQHEINRIRKIIEGVRLVKAHESDQVQEHAVRLVLERAIAIAEFKRPYKNVHITTWFSKDLPAAYLCELNIENAFTELLKYALEFAGQTGGVHVNVNYLSEQSEFEFCIQIKAGPDADLDTITINFNQQKSFKKKVNMGLLQAFASIYNHCGRLSMRNREGEADIIVKLPRVPSKS